MPGIGDRCCPITFSLPAIGPAILGNAEADQIAAAHIQAQFERTCQRFSGGCLSLARTRCFLDLTHAQPIADGLNKHLQIRQVGIRFAPRNTGNGYRKDNFRAAHIVPVRMATNRFWFVDRGPCAANRIFHPEIEIGFISHTAVPDGGFKTITIGHYRRDLIPEANIGMQPRPPAEVRQDHRMEF